MTTVDLIALGTDIVADWSFGMVLPVPLMSPPALTAAVDAHLAENRPDALFFWDSRLGPPPTNVLALLDQPDDVWHAGLALGTGGQPSAIDLVAPTWMLNADPTVVRPATSWRLSLAACIVRAGVVRRLGFLDPAFVSLTAASLEMGHRWINQGAFCRHEPDLVANVQNRPALEPIGAEDQLRFIHRRFGSSWAGYTTLRSRRRLRGLRRLRALRREDRSPPATLGRPEPPSPGIDARVSVIVPTIDRYPWLHTLLDHLADQTVAPHEVLVVDQTPADRRKDLTASAPAGLPLRVITSKVAGQCTARNLAMTAATGDLLLFVDDDDELPPDLIANHLARLAQTGADANCGIAVEPGEHDLDPAFRRLRQSDVFPTNNTLLRRDALHDTGLFDLAFDRGERADHDLGMRLYLSGCRLVLDPGVEVLHHHAPRGGLRSHAARVSTYRASRHSTIARHALAPTELYLWRRYFRADQVSEAVRLRLLGTFSRRGRVGHRVLRAFVQLFLLRDTRRQLADAATAADELSRRHPIIPLLPEDAGTAAS